MHRPPAGDPFYSSLCSRCGAVRGAGAFWFAVPQQPSQKQLPPDSTPLSEHWYVDLNTADAAVLCTLPGVGPSHARALIEYRQQHGPFARVADAAAVPGLTEDLVASWEGQATVNTPAQTMP